jgi:hypothetical protein
MDYGKVLKKAWQMVWRYRMLWVFGFILSLVAGEGGASSGFQYTSGQGGFPPSGARATTPQIPADVWGIVAAVVIGLLCLGVVIAIVVTIVRYVTETAVIRVVDDYEKTGEKRGFRQGFRMGWSRTSGQIFLIDLLVNVPVILVFFLLGLLSAIPLLAWVTDNTAVRTVGTGVTVCLSFLVMLLFIIVSVILLPLRTFFWRACALEELGAIDSIRRGYAMVRRHLQDVVVMLLITVGLALAWSIVMIPIVLLLVLLGGVVAGVPALLVGWLASLAFKETVPWVLATVVGLPIFILVLVVPLTVLDGVMKVFQSTTWTLTYRELLALEK